MQKTVRLMSMMVAAAAIVAAGAPPAGAVTLNPHGLGQVLIYPYYTVNAGFGTLLTVVNTTPAGKALKVRFHEGYDGRDVLDFNLYLSPNDVWVGEVFDTSADGSGAAALASFDHSCTVPAYLLPVDPGSGPPRLNFSTVAYTGANADGGPTTPARTREGYLEIIEMGEVTNALHGSLEAITHSGDGAPPNCTHVVDAWASIGYWYSDPTSDMDPPGGGLYGAESIINVGSGLMYTVNAEAMEGFSDIVQHTAPDAAKPDLASASKSGDGTVTAFVAVGASGVAARFTKPEDAVSALFMVDTLYNEYVVDPGVGATTDWIVTLPTKRFYTDPELLGSAQAPSRRPFDAPFNSADGGSSCVPVGGDVFDREELTILGGFELPGVPRVPNYALCLAANPMVFAPDASALGSGLPHSFGEYSNVVDVAVVPFVSGHFRADFTIDSTGAARANGVLTSADGVTLRGLPAIGFAATNYVDGSVTPGTLANYSGAYPHRAHVTCTQGDGQSCP